MKLAELPEAAMPEYGEAQEFATGGIWDRVSRFDFDYMNGAQRLRSLVFGRFIAHAFYKSLDSIRERIADIEEVPAPRFWAPRGAVFPEHAAAAVWRIQSRARLAGACFLLQVGPAPREMVIDFTIDNTPFSLRDAKGLRDGHEFVDVISEKTEDFIPGVLLGGMAFPEISGVVHMMYLRQAFLSGRGDYRKSTIAFDHADARGAWPWPQM